MVTWPVPWSLLCTSDWYQARPKFVNPATGDPSAFWLLFWTVNRSKSRLGRNPDNRSVRVSLSLPRVTVAFAVAVCPGACRQETVSDSGTAGRSFG
jgi:hypothetical protein